MKGTVNGKSLDQVLSELKAPFPEEELKKNEKNETYIPVESLESRLNSVIGVLNYDTLVTYEGIQEVLGRFVVVAKTILIIYDDERNALIRKSALGGSNIIVVKDTGKPISQLHNRKVSKMYVSCFRLVSARSGAASSAEDRMALSSAGKKRIYIKFVLRLPFLRVTNAIRQIVWI